MSNSRSAAPLMPMPSLYSVPRTKACQSCWTAKAKCEPDVDYTKCKRCNRQNLECLMREAVARKRRKHTPKGEDQEAEERVTRNESEDGSTNSSPPYTELELEFGIQFYANLLSPYVPFVVLSSNTQNSRKLAEEKPFLAMVLAMLGCIHHRARQRALALECRKYLAVHILEKGEKSLDLLQGLLLKIHWYHWQAELPSQRVVFMHLAMAMVVNLELNKSPLGRSRLKNVVEMGKGFEVPFGVTDHNLEEKRAFLGCLYLSSVLSKCATHMDGLRFSEYAERCCEYLQESQIPSDQDAVRLLRCQQIVEKFETARSLFFQARRANALIHDGFSQVDQVNIMAFVDQWEAELTRYWMRIPDSEKTDLLHVQYAYARICLFETSIEDSWFSNDSDRIEVLHKCLAAIQALHSTFVPLTQQPSILLNVPSHLFAESSHSTFVAIQLGSVKCTGWSYKLMEKELNLLHVFDNTVKSIDKMLSSYLPTQIPAFFFRIAPMGKSIKNWYVAKLLSWEEGDQTMDAIDKPPVPEHDVDLDFLGQFLDLDDNLWLQNLLSPEEIRLPILTS